MARLAAIGPNYQCGTFPVASLWVGRFLEGVDALDMILPAALWKARLLLLLDRLRFRLG